MKVLVTGCAGLIGSNFCRWLGSDVDIIGVDDLSGGVSVPDNVTFIRANLTDPSDQIRVSEQFPFDYVFHFAAYAAEGLSPFIRQHNYMNNTVATAFLVSESIKHSVKRFVFTSSMAVYGSQPAPFEETMNPTPIDPYGVAKYACEMDLKIAYDQHGLSYCILRPHNVYGPGQNIWDPYRNVLGIWMYQTLTKTPMTIYGDGKQKRAFSYVDDILPCIWQAAVNPEAHCEIINVGGIQETELNEAIKCLGHITEHTDHIHLEARHEAKNAWSTYQKSIDIIGYKETIGLTEGLTRMWNWVKEQPERTRKFWKVYELETGLYSFWNIKNTTHI
jgi:UDP-glucose 4-epimerase